MSEKKTKITHSQDKARFLGYDITTAKNSALMQSSGHTEMPIQAVGQEQPVPDDKGASGNMDYTEEDVKKYQMDPDINELLISVFAGNDSRRLQNIYKWKCYGIIYGRNCSLNFRRKKWCRIRHEL